MNITFPYKFFIVSIFVAINDLFAHDTNETNSNRSFEAFKALGDIFEPLFNTHANNITVLLVVFSTLFGGYVTFIAITTVIKMNKIEATIDSNRDSIQGIKTDVIEKMNTIDIQTRVNIDNLEKWLITQTNQIYQNSKEDIKDVKNSIEDRITYEIISSSKQILKGIEDHSYRKIELKIEEIKRNTQKRLFNYQELIYKINQLKKIEYDEVLTQPIEINEKLQQMVSIQNLYNETNNITIPNLLSEEVHAELIPALKKLSDNLQLQPIIISYFKSLLNANEYSYSEKIEIKDTLKTFYKYDYDTEQRVASEKKDFLK